MNQKERTRRLGLLGAAALVAAAVVVVLIAVSQGGEEDPGEGLGGGQALSGVRATNELVEGIPQDGAALGDPDAPVRLIEFVDLQCPFCAQYTADVLPTVVDRYVRTGQVKLELRPLAFLGDDSVRGAAAAAAAAEQDRMWQFVDLFFLNQGEENAGYATDSFLRRVARGAGVEPGPIVSAANAGQATPLLVRAEREASRFGVDSTPSFLVARGRSTPEPLQLDELSPEAFTEQLDAAIGGA